MSGLAKGFATEGTEGAENSVRQRLGRWSLLLVLMVAGSGLADADVPRQAGSSASPLLRDGPVVRLSRDFLERHGLEHCNLTPTEVGFPVLMFSKASPEQWHLLDATATEDGFQWRPPGDGLYILGNGRPPASNWMGDVKVPEAAKGLLWIRVGSTAGTHEAIEKALSALVSGDAAGAARICADAAAHDPDGGELHAGWGLALLALERWSEAECVLEIALRSQPAADTAFNLAIARYRLKAWDRAWSACVLCLKWSSQGSRLQERAAEIGYAIARRLEERLDREAAYREIAKWAPETDGGREAADQLK